MDYMTLKEASGKMGCNTFVGINYYCSAGRIPGAVKMGTVWLIPKSAQKPKDGRRKENKHEKNLLFLSFLLLLTSCSGKKDNKTISIGYINWDDALP